jgi:hypothetical protein
MQDDGMVVPSGPDELFTQYYGYVKKIVGGTPMIPPQDAEDVAMEIMTRLIERDVVGMFDPGMTFSHDDKEIPARFRTFLTAQVNLYVKGQRDKLGRQRKRELLIIDTPSEDGLSWADMFGSEDDLSGLDAAEWVRQARSFLATVPRRSDRDRCDLVALFDEMIAQVAATGTTNTREIAVRLGVSPVVTGRWKQWLRQNLRQRSVLSRRVTIAGEAYTVAHVNQAVALLRARRGSPHVKGPLQAADNPLWRIDYHRISRHERAVYPGIEVPSGNRHQPAPHVLNAIVHYLERAVVT